MPNPETSWNHGDVVQDREDDDPDPAIVVNTPGAPANEWDVPRLGKTVAEDNPEYPPDAEIVTVVYEENRDVTQDQEGMNQLRVEAVLFVVARNDD